MPNEAFIRPVHRFDPPLDAVGVVEAFEESHERTFDTFLDALYAAMLEPERLREALRTFAKLFRAEDGAICLARGGAARSESQLLLSAFGHGKNGDSGKSLAGTVREQLIAALDVHGRVAQADVSRGQIGANGKIGQVHFLALTTVLSDQRSLALVALRPNRAFSDEDRRIAAALLPDVERAFNLHLTHTAGRSASLDNQLFETSTIAQILTCQKFVERANTRARKLLEVKGPVTVRGRVLHFEDARVQLAFESLSEASAETAPASTFASVVASQDGATWLAQLSRLKRRTESPLLAAALGPSPVLIALTQFNTASSSRELPLDGFTELSTIERTILSAIVDGRDIGEISANMRRSSETIRWHVKRMFAKLGVSSQADLARLGTLLLPISF